MKKTTYCFILIALLILSSACGVSPPATLDYTAGSEILSSVSTNPTTQATTGQTSASTSIATTAQSTATTATKTSSETSSAVSFSAITAKTSSNAVTETVTQTQKTTNISSVNYSANALSEAKKTVNKMSLDEKIWQMFFLSPEKFTGESSHTIAGKASKDALKGKPVGGLLFHAYNFVSPAQTKKLLSDLQSYSTIPLFLSVDEEGGGVARIGNNALMNVPKVPSMSSIGKTKEPTKAYGSAKTIAGYLTKLGFNLDFAPVADVITNPDNKVVLTRSFGKDAQLVSQMVEQSVKGFQKNGISATLKHFPGHGGTASDSHKGYTVTKRTLEQMRVEEFLPFKKGIAAGVDFVMTAHITATKTDDSGLPASLSKFFITDILKNELGFKKLVITDSLGMGAITKEFSSGKACVIAIEAGVDILLNPASADNAFTAVKSAVKSGRLTEARIDESVVKIIAAKIDRGVM